MFFDTVDYQVYLNGLKGSDFLNCLFHYRDREKRDIDFIIEREDQALLGIEVKAGSVISKYDFKHLRRFKDNIAGDRPFIGVVLYLCEVLGSMGDDFWVVPFANLWEKER